MFTSHFKMSAQPFLERTPVERMQKDERIQRLLIDTLGLVGETETLAVLLGSYYSSTREVVRALCRLANGPVPSDLNTREELKGWWREHRPGLRADWVKRGFREAGVDLAEPWDRKRVPALLDLLADPRHYVRLNAVRILRRISGRRLPIDALAGEHDSPQATAERNTAIGQWREWWEATRKK